MLEFFTQDDWSFFKVEAEPALQLAIEATNGRWNCYAEANEEQQQMVFYSLCPINAPASKRQALAEFLTIINYGTIIGNFELDMEDGQIRYKTSEVNEDMVIRIYLKVSTITVVQDIKSRLQTLKLMHRYWGIAERIRLLIESVNKQGEPSIGSKAKAALVELQKLFSSIDARLQQFATGSLQPKVEIEALIEIGQLTEKLPVYEQVLKDVGYLGS